MIPDSFVEEEERQRTISKIFTKLKELEEDPHRPSTTSSSIVGGVSQSASSAGASFNKTAAATTGGGSGNGANAGFFNGNGGVSGQGAYGNGRARENECISFKNIKENQVVTAHSNFSTGGYHG